MLLNMARRMHLVPMAIICNEAVLTTTATINIVIILVFVVVVAKNIQIQAATGRLIVATMQLSSAPTMGMNMVLKNRHKIKTKRTKTTAPTISAETAMLMTVTWIRTIKKTMMRIMITLTVTTTMSSGAC